LPFKEKVVTAWDGGTESKNYQACMALPGISWGLGAPELLAAMWSGS